MILFLNTGDRKYIEVALKEGGRILAKKKISAERKQSEKLLPLIDRILKDNKKTLKDIRSIEVVDRGGTFTSLRIGVVTANALGYALAVPVRGVGNPESACSVRFGSARRADRSGIGEREGLTTGGKRAEFNIVKPIYDKEPNIMTKLKVIKL